VSIFSLVNWFYPIETEVCARARGIIGELIGGEPDAEREQRTAKPTAVRQLSKQIQLVRIFVVEGLQRPVTKQLV